MPIATASHRDTPQNLEAEKALLGSILLDNAALAIAEPLIEEDDFSSHAHKLIWLAMVRLRKAGKAIDNVTLYDELRQRGEHEKAGDALYLAQLTDGVPIGTAAPVTAYCDILRREAAKRQILIEGQYFAQQNVQGQSIEDMAADAQRLATDAQRLATRGAGKPKTPKAAGAQAYGEFPEIAWHGATKIYRSAMGKTSEASDNFHLAGFLTVTGAMLGKSIAVGADEDSYIYPNLYTLFVGGSGECKDQAAKKALTWMKKTAAGVFVVNHVASAETWIDELSEAKKKREEQADHTPLRTLLYLSELRDLIEKSKQKGQGTIVSKFTQAFDVPAELNARTRGQPTGFVRNVVTSILSCTNPDWMKDLDMKDLKGGLGSRVCFVPGEMKAPDRRWQPPDPASIEILSDRLRSVHLAYPLHQTKRFIFSEESETLLDTWYGKHKSMLSDDPLIKFLAVRDIVHVYKISLIHAALDLKTVIETYHVKAAIAFVEFLRDIRPVVFEGHGFSPTQVAQAAAERIIKERGRIGYSDALRLFSRRYGDSMLFKRIIDSLGLVGGPVEVQITQGARPKRFLVWRGGE